MASLLRSAARRRPAVNALLRSAAPHSSAALLRSSTAPPSTAALLRSAAPHSSAALLRSSTAALLRPSSSSALVCPRRRLSAPAPAPAPAPVHINSSDICRVEAAVAARYDSASHRVNQLRFSMNKLTSAVGQQEVDITANVGDMSYKVTAAVLTSAIFLGLASYILLYSMGGRSARAAAADLVDGKAGEIEGELVKKIEDLYKEQEESNREATARLDKREAANKAKELDLIAREAALKGGN